MLLDEPVLPRAYRLRRSAEFGQAVRRGARAGAPTVVVHRWDRFDNEPVRVGFVVSKAVGNAVARNQVKRRLRHLMADRLAVLTPHSSLVVRANPAAADASSADLGRDIDICLGVLTRRPPVMRTAP